MEVNNIDHKDEKRMIKELKSNGQDEIVIYINALNNVIEGQQEVHRLAMKKIIELREQIKRDCERYDRGDN